MKDCFGLLVMDVMPIYMIIAMNNIITMYFSINYLTVICPSTLYFAFEREASSENYGPRVYFNHITKTKISLLQFYFLYFTLQITYLPLLDLILAINEFKGIDNPLARIWCKRLVLCV